MEIWYRGLLPLVLLAWLPGSAAVTWGDAIVVSKAMSAPTVAEVFVGEDAVRVELEIGVEDLAAFQDLMPDKIYEKMNSDKRTFPQRIQQFFKKGWRIRTDQGDELVGHVVKLEARKRIKRDKITGQPLTIQPADAEIVVYAELSFDLEGKPKTIAIQPPVDLESKRPTANIGFVTYHRGLPVSDFRYLVSEAILVLDWEDPWYSHFRHPNLRREFDSPVSAFLYIEPFEVRKEIVIRPVDVQRWIDLDIDINGMIPVESQATLKQRVSEFLKDKHPVTIDGKLVQGEIDRVHFISRTLRKTGVVYPDQDLPACAATLGVIVVYPIEQLPQEVTVTWEMFDSKLQKLPASATDEAGGLPSTLTPDDPVLVWKNYLTNPTIPAMRSVPPPPVGSRVTLPLISIIVVFGSLIAVLRISNAEAIKRNLLAWLILSLVVGWAFLPFARISVANPLAKRDQVTDEETDEIMDSLLHNLYHAFDRRQESLVYDQLAITLSGDLLNKIYLQTRKQIQLADQGGAQVKIDTVMILANDIQSFEDRGFSCRCNWVVSGTIGHWGHLHRRKLGYEADFQVEPSEQNWKITSMQITNETGPDLLATDQVDLSLDR